MTKEEMSVIVVNHLSRFRNMTYSALTDLVDKPREIIDATASDGTAYRVYIESFWDDGKPGGDVRVLASLWLIPSKPLLGFIPIYSPEITDCFILSPDGKFIGE
jgi:hypothetical protein